MESQTSVDPYWAALTVWVVVNAVNLLQAVGFISRVRTGSQAINRKLGYVIIALAVPAAVALIAFVRAGAGWLYWLGPAVYLAFVVFEVMVDYVRVVGGLSALGIPAGAPSGNPGRAWCHPGSVWAHRVQAGR